MGVRRSYELRFTNTTPNASLGELQEALYRTPLINDGTENNEYEIDEAGTWLITKTHGSHTKIIPDFHLKPMIIFMRPSVPPRGKIFPLPIFSVTDSR